MIALSRIVLPSAKVPASQVKHWPQIPIPAKVKDPKLAAAIDMGSQIYRKEATFQQISKKWTNQETNSSHSDASSGMKGSEESEDEQSDAQSSSSTNKSSLEEPESQESIPAQSKSVVNKEKFGSAKSKKGAVNRSRDRLFKSQRVNLQELDKTTKQDNLRTLHHQKRDSQPRAMNVNSRTATLFDDENDFQRRPNKNVINRTDTSMDRQEDPPRGLRSATKSGGSQGLEYSKKKPRNLDHSLKITTGDPPKGLRGEQTGRMGPPGRANTPNALLNSRNALLQNFEDDNREQDSSQLLNTLTLEEIANSASKKHSQHRKKKLGSGLTSNDGSKTPDLVAVPPLHLRNLTEPEQEAASQIPKPNKVATNPKPIEAPSKPKSKLTIFVAGIKQDSKPHQSLQDAKESKQPLPSNSGKQGAAKTQEKVHSSELMSLHLTTKVSNVPSNPDGNPPFSMSAFKVTQGTQRIEYHPALTTRVSEQEMPNTGITNMASMSLEPIGSQQPQNLHQELAIPNPNKPRTQPARQPDQLAVPQTQEYPTPEEVELINQNTTRFLDQTRDDSSYNTDALRTMYRNNIEQNEKPMPEIPLNTIIPIKDKQTPGQRSQPEAIEIISPQASEEADDPGLAGVEPSQLSMGRVGHEESYYLLSAEQREFYKKTNQELMDFLKRFQEWSLSLNTRNSRQITAEVDHLFASFKMALNRADTSKIPSEVLFNHEFGYSLSEIVKILKLHKEDIPPRHVGLLHMTEECLRNLDERVQEDLFHSEDLNEKFQIRLTSEKASLGKRLPRVDFEGPRIIKPALLPHKSAKQEEEKRIMQATQPLQFTESATRRQAYHVASLINYIERILVETHQVSEATRLSQGRAVDSGQYRAGLSEKTKRDALNLLVLSLSRCRGTQQEKQTLAAELESKIRALRNKDEDQYRVAVQAVAEQMQREDVDHQAIFNLARSELSHFNLYLSTITEPNMFMLN